MKMDKIQPLKMTGSQTACRLNLLFMSVETDRYRLARKVRCGSAFLFLFSCIFILLSRESDQCAIRARLGVAGHLSTTPRWGNPAKCLSQRHNK